MPRLTSTIINNHVSADPEPWLLKAVTDHFWEQYLEAGKDTKAFAVELSSLRIYSNKEGFWFRQTARIP